MNKKKPSSFWGKFILICFTINLVTANVIISNLSAKEVAPQQKILNPSSPQGTTVTIETSGPITYKSFFFNNPSRLVLSFSPGVLRSQLNQEIPVNSGMVRKIYCHYYKASKDARWVKSITFILLAKTNYDIRQNDNKIFIQIQNTPEQSINSALVDEMVIKDYMPKGYGSVERRKAIRAAIKTVRIKKQLMKPFSKTEETVPSVLVEKKSDDSVAITAANLSPTQMIATGAIVLFTGSAQGFSEGSKQIISQGPTVSSPVYSVATLKAADMVKKGFQASDFATASLGFVSILIGAYIVDSIRQKKVNKTGKKRAKTSAWDSIVKVLTREYIVTDTKPKKGGIEELFLKEEELHKLSVYNQVQPGDKPDFATHTSVKDENINVVIEQKKENELVAPEIVNKQDSIEPKLDLNPEEIKSDIDSLEKISGEPFSFPQIPDIAERRRFPRADIRNTRGILNRALVGSKTQPFKNIRINDISKGGLSFLVKSKETKFKIPTMVKLYFSNSTKPVDVWVRIVWEKDDQKGEGKNVGAKFTKVPKESWDKIMGAFGHRLC